MSRKPRKKRGGQPGNHNAVKHSAYVARHDGRTIPGRAQRQIEATLVSALGGTEAVSPQEILIIQRVAVKAIRCALIENQILAHNGELPESLSQLYLAWSRSLREDLKALGLSRRAKPVPDIREYLNSKYA